MNEHNKERIDIMSQFVLTIFGVLMLFFSGYLVNDNFLLSFILLVLGGSAINLIRIYPYDEVAE